MADIFISYAHEDKPFVQNMVPGLEAEGFSVWWDHTIPPGKTWDEVISRGIEEARCCVVLWSRHSIVSDWVKEEAAIAKQNRKFIPVLIDETDPPMGFRRVQAAQLHNWTGDTKDPQWVMLIQEARSLIADARSQGLGASEVRHTPPASPPAEPPKPNSRTPLIAGLVVAGVLAIGALVVFLPSLGFFEEAAHEVSSGTSPASTEGQGVSEAGTENAVTEEVALSNQPSADQRELEEAQRLAEQERAARQRVEERLAEVERASSASRTPIQPEWLLGTWRYRWNASRSTYTGTIDVGQSGGNRLTAVIVVRGTDTLIRQNARVEINGNDVRFDGYEITSTTHPNWGADNFIVERIGDRLVGTSIDDNGLRGRSIEIYR